MADAAALTHSPRVTGLFMDFDGTLAEIVSEPSKAGPLEGIPETLEELGRSFGVVALVSGRAAAELVGWFGNEVELWGLYGAERSVAGEITLAEDVAPYASLMRRVAEEAKDRLRATGIDGLLVEDKGVMVGLHWRRADDVGAAGRIVTEVAGDLAERHGIEQSPGKLALELRPPVEWSKGDVVRRRVGEEGLRAAAFVGDDYGDLTAFDALDELAQSGVATVRVGVASSEMPEELKRRAEIELAGPPAVLEWLRSLLAAIPR